MNQNIVTNEELARMVKDGFDHVDSRFDSVETDIKTLKSDVSDIKLRLDHCVYRFEFKELQQRVETLEK